MKSLRWKVARTAHGREQKRLTRLKRGKRHCEYIGESVPTHEARIQCPEIFALDDKCHDSVVACLRSLRLSFKDGLKTICLDFRRTRQMVAGGTLLLFSEIQRLKEMFPAVPVRCLPSKDETVNQVLQHLGIFNLLGYRSSIVPTRADVVSWRYASSSEIDGKKVGQLLENYESLSMPLIGRLFRGAGEAMVNVRHAYESSRNDGLPSSDQKKWWMFCRESENSIAVAVCDLGIGIPRSLPIKYPQEMITAIVSKLFGKNFKKLMDDARMIQAAMQIRRTSTDLHGRGKGLADFLRVFDLVPNAKLFIFSNRGLVYYAGGKYKRTTFEGSIKGTIVLWIVPLDNGEERAHF